MKKIKYLLLAFFFLTLFVKSYGQQDTVSEKLKIGLHLKARSYGDSIVLRWVMDKFQAWGLLNHYGYILQRLTLDDATNRQLTADFQPLTNEAIKPWSLEEWQQKADTRDTLAMLAAWCLHGEESNAEGLPLIAALKQISNEQENRFGLALYAADLSRTAADGLGLRFVDRDIEVDKKYIYRLLVQDSLQLYQIDTAIYILNPAHQFEPEVPFSPEIKPGDGSLILEWPFDRRYSAYYIERSADGKTFEKLNRTPYVMTYSKPGKKEGVVYVDTSTVNYQPYYYRIQGYDVFGDLSEYSEIVDGYSTDQTPPMMPQLILAENTRDLMVELQWIIADTSDVVGFIVSRGSEFAGPFKPLHDEQLPPDTRSFIDYRADEFGKNFYRVTAIDKENNMSHTIPYFVGIKNQAPPDVPSGLSGEIDTNGVMKIWWKPNTEPDLKGYLVAYANQADHPFVNLSQQVIADTFLIDSLNLNTLTEQIFIKVKAVDVHYAASEFSEILELKKPDIVPPVSPVFLKYLVQDSSIYLNWAFSSSDDVVQHLLYRKEKDDTQEIIAELDNDATEYLDKEVSPGSILEYTLVAVDDAGLQSPPSFPLRLKAFDSGIRPPVTLEAAVNEEKGFVHLSWNYALSENIRFILYRAAGDESLRQYKSIAGTASEFEDWKVRKGQSYRYGIQAVFKDGGKSPLSGEQVVKMELQRK